MALVAGIDSSTQSCKVFVRDADTGELVRHGRAGHPDGTEIAPQLDLRVELDLYAGVRPARAIPGIPLPLADPRAAAIDLVVIRESTEGLFASRGKGVVSDDREARDTMVITRAGSERVHDFAFRLALRRKARAAHADPGNEIPCEPGPAGRCGRKCR